MNIIDVINNHRSIRSYSREAIDEELLNKMLSSLRQMPNSINGQQVTLLNIKDQELKEKLTILSGNDFIRQAPVLIVFLMDYYKASLAGEINNEKLIIYDNPEALMTACTDVGILLAALTIEAESMDLGTCIIGGIRKNSQEVCKLLKLPEYVFPIAAMTIGYPREIPKQKPRLPLSTFLQENYYHTENLKEKIIEYDHLMEAYLDSINRKEIEGDWSKKVCKVYKDDAAFPNLIENLADQKIKIGG